MLKKYGRWRPDFRVNSPKRSTSRWRVSSMKSRWESCTGLSRKAGGSGQWPQQQVLRAGTAAMVQLATVGEAGAQVQPPRRVVVAVHREHQQVRRWAALRQVREDHRQHLAAQSAALPAGVDEESIGRASCRERVCQYV